MFLRQCNLRNLVGPLSSPISGHQQRKNKSVRKATRAVNSNFFPNFTPLDADAAVVVVADVEVTLDLKIELESGLELCEVEGRILVEDESNKVMLIVNVDTVGSELRSVPVEEREFAVNLAVEIVGPGITEAVGRKFVVVMIVMAKSVACHLMDTPKAFTDIPDVVKIRVWLLSLSVDVTVKIPLG